MYFVFCRVQKWTAVADTLVVLCSRLIDQTVHSSTIIMLELTASRFKDDIIYAEFPFHALGAEVMWMFLG